MATQLPSLQVRERGFTLVEALMVLGIMAVLVALAIPSYRATGLKAKRAEAAIAMSTLVAQQHRFFTACDRYAEGFAAEESCVAGTLPGRGATAGGLYDLSFSPADGGFIVRAVARPGGSQVSDTGCTTLTFRFQSGELHREPASCF